MACDLLIRNVTLIDVEYTVVIRAVAWERGALNGAAAGIVLRS